LNLDLILWLIGLFAEIAVLGLCLKGRLFRITPVFCAYLAWSLLVDITFYFLRKSPNYFRVYTVEMVVDSIFQFVVLVELGWAVLRPIRASLPKYSILILTLIFLVAAAVIWPISGHMIPAEILQKWSIFFFRMQQTVAVLRVVIFMALVGFSQLLSIGWRDRELQIATGLGFYSMCSLAIWVIHSHQTVSAKGSYRVLDQIGVAAYLCSLGYWVFSFAQQAEQRQQFTPEMRNFLLALTGGGRSSHRPG
jgi:hypothetical protein